MASTGQGRGRVNQKRRTRAALVEAARRLLERDTAPTVAEVADAALVSRATAYRYFPSREHLLIDAVLTRSIDELDRAVTAATRADDPGARIDGLVRTIHHAIASNPAAFRTLVQLSVGRPASTEPSVASIRGARRTQWIERALEPARSDLDPRSRDRLARALALCVGAEAHIVLRDLCGLKDHETEATLRWAARALLTAAIDESRSGANDSERSRAG